MKNNITELVFILDRSGSMSGLEQDTTADLIRLLKSNADRTASAMFQPYCLITKPRFFTTGLNCLKFQK